MARCKKTDKYRSKFEEAVSKVLGKDYQYEPKNRVLKYTVPESHHKYLPDFVKDDIYIECKGRLTLDDRKKMKLLGEQYPDLRIIMVLQAPNNPIRKGSKTTYSKWCEQNNIEWCSLTNLKQHLRKT